jgi:hypothetical protein
MSGLNQYKLVGMSLASVLNLAPGSGCSAGAKFDASDIDVEVRISVAVHGRVTERFG